MGNIYHPSKQCCESVDLSTNNSERMKRSTLGQKIEKRSDDLETFETMVLGRIVHIGDLYDAKKGEVLAGVSFWKDDAIKSNVRRSFLPSMRTHFFAGQTSFERLDSMNIEAELKLDFLGKKVLRIPFKFFQKILCIRMLLYMKLMRIIKLTFSLITRSNTCNIQ